MCFELETGESSNWDHKNVWNLPLPWKHQKSIGFLNWFGQAPLILEAEFGDDFPVYSLFFFGPTGSDYVKFNARVTAQKCAQPTKL